MRRSVWTRVLAVLLIISLLAAPVSAAGIHGNGANGWGFGGLIDFIWDIIRDIIDDLINPGEPEPTEPIETTPPTVPEETTVPTEPVETEPEVTEPEETQPEETEPEVTEPEETEPEEEVEKVMSVVEHQSNTDNGSLLRATTYNLAPVADSTESVNTISTFSTRNVAPYALNAASAVATTADETSDAEATAEGTTVKYFPVTMFNYDQSTINAATDLLDNDLTVREGMYFSNGSTDVVANMGTTGGMEEFVAGQYYIENSRAAAHGAAGTWLVGSTSGITSTADQEDATLWTLVIEDGKYYLMSGEYYLTIGWGTSNTALSTTKAAINITDYTGGAYQNTGPEYYEGAVQLSNASNYFLVQYGGLTVTTFGGHTGNNDTGNAMRFYRVEGDSQTLTTITDGESYVASGYELWNRWAYGSADNNAQNKFYTGLVQNTLLDDEIVFNVLEGGIFNTDSDVKSIYEYVGLPFVLDTTTGVYSFNSDDNGVYFADTDNDGDADPASGTKDNAYNLYFDEGNTQGWSGMNTQFGDGSNNLWAPYNTNTNDTGEGVIDYHFGMRADLPFSMTPNGRVKSTDDESDPITFTFAGDDDVWIYIDGVLVIDLGGIHNRLGATVDFAANTITYYIPDSNKSDTAANPLGCHNDPDNFQVTKKLFNDADGEGVIKMTRDAFAADIDHEMQIFYLERGKGTSNCHIEFNLPMKDEVIITKDATKSWSEAAEKADLAINPDDPNAGVDDLTDAEQAIINNIDFGFTLYKKTADGEYAPVANTNFYLEGTGAATPPIRSTNENGHFTLKNGQSARFVTEIPADGVTYYVVEDAVPEGFVSPDFNFAGTATGGFDWTDGTAAAVHVTDGSLIPEQVIDLEASENKSYEVTVYGSIESTDTVEFICSNFLNEELPNPTATTIEDIIVIDYGLPVDIDPLHNDVYRGDSIEIVYFGNETVTMTETTGADGIVSATWSGEQTFDFGTVAFNDVTFRGEYDTDGKFIGDRDTFTYTLNKQLTEVEVITYVIKVTGSEVQGTTEATKYQYDYAIGKVYIVPATIMYYEENFSDLITFTGSNWVGTETTAGASARQEPGVVGTVGDSTYGSDAAYLEDSYDSNGTSYYANTTNGAVRFQYTFTGTGTSIFARTSANTGYVQIKLYKGTDTSAETGVLENITYRDTYWKDENNTTLDSSGTLYNIPIYTESDLDYGTYTVVATVAKAGTPTSGNETGGAGNEFYLDGIRIMQPLNEDSDAELVEKALDAYATDGEANLDVVTLRQKLITDAEDGVAIWDGTNFVVMTDIDDTLITAEDYTSIGPKEEVYLTPGQKVSFSLKYWKTEGLNLYIGMKAPFGNAKLKVGQSSYNLLNAADCYYDVTTNYSSLIIEEEQGKTAEGYWLYEDANGEVYYLADDGEYYDYDTDAVYTGTEELSKHMVSYYVVTYTFEATDKIVALTNIKVVGNYEFTIVENTDIEVPGDEGGDVVVDGSEG